MIDKAYLTSVLKTLLCTPSPVGMTEQAVARTHQWLTELGFTPKYTRRGVLYITLGSEEPKRALAAHLDTLGAMVTQLKPNGRLALRNTGTWAARFAEGARVTVFSDNHQYRGTILPLKASGHRFNTEVDTQIADWDNLEIRLDAPCYNFADLQSHGLNVGDIVAVDAQPEFIDNGFIVSRHLDDKAGCAVMLAALKSLVDDGVVPAVPCQMIFTISEEVGIGGTHGFGPQVQELLAIDNSVSAPDQTTRDDALTLAFRDRTGPFDLAITRHLLQLCQQYDIPHVRDTFKHYRSDSAAAIDAGWDIRAALACFALDSSHGWERTHLDSLVALATLVRRYIESDLVPLPGQLLQS
ncbi:MULTISPECIES: osmoprotectant NAGGN system M42 family peptidase [Providencia]|uniref:osmoprotectant NAGGN system M42 family peptidase n=1 Tax=Providencia TaxID=586 RepID=UPI0013DE82A2|nr:MULTISPECIES: osmoprotectant NAGGN system M42 family peptidase [Providencia]EHZ7763968.1 osmoprotectant NAGGN system M42 family peptidase [Providencia rettgeri]EIJ7167110.1 osmoprotectant NAGGN system M42 family peptidase [Providencia rettgeri]EJD6048826.1 osmoprotectant NAGGN system M42 family peptidase [Providencia rettgeri]ELR5092443.1 osmoprotectant NAGGN system M42 family peptidase [Providencia rettgeri]ELR5105583.1 osmoprotectant NAGGN system M42 family peptidase [Providencia rettgeri